MNIHIKTEGGTAVRAYFGFSYACKKCGHTNEVVRLNPFNNPYITIEANEPQRGLMCHKCDDVESFQLELG